MRLVLFVSAFVAVASLTPGVASAVVYGNAPDLLLEVDRYEQDFASADVTLDKVRLHYCGGGYADYEVDTSIDPVAGHSVAVQNGDYCGVTAFWATDLYIDGANGAFTLRYSPDSTYVALSGTTQSADLAPFTVVDGFIHGGNPKLWITIQ
jgi:hypothetical protein